MVRKLLQLILVIGIITPGHSQQRISTDVEAWVNIRMTTNNTGYDPGLNGGGVGVGIQKSLKKSLQSYFSVEFGSAGITNYLAVKAGLSKPIAIQTSKWVYSPGFNVLQGIGLFRSNPLYMWGLEQFNSLDFKFNGSSGPGLILGFRYYGYPGYDQYSKVHNFFDIRAGLKYTF